MYSMLNACYIFQCWKWMLRFFILNKVDGNRIKRKKIATKEEVVKTWRIMGSIIFERERLKKTRKKRHFHEARWKTWWENHRKMFICCCTDNKPHSAHSQYFQLFNTESRNMLQHVILGTWRKGKIYICI